MPVDGMDGRAGLGTGGVEEEGGVDGGGVDRIDGGVRYWWCKGRRWDGRGR